MLCHMRNQRLRKYRRSLNARNILRNRIKSAVKLRGKWNKEEKEIKLRTESTINQDTQKSFKIKKNSKKTFDTKRSSSNKVGNGISFV